MKSIKEIFDPWWEKLVWYVRNRQGSGMIINIEFDDVALGFSYNYDIYELVQRNELRVSIGEGPYGLSNTRLWERNARASTKPIPISQLESLKKSLIKELNRRGYTVE